MLIKFSHIYRKYKLKIKGILHIGAHECEEKNDYEKYKISNIHWVEAMNDKVIMMKNKYQDINIYNAVISDKDNEEVEFNISNNGQSSSILELGTHKHQHPTVHYINKINKKTKTLSSLIKEENINMSEINFMNLDIQGVELKALKGMGDYLKNIDYIYTEVNVEHLYVGCNLMPELDNYLSSFGFKRVETKILDHGWGDAFYIKNI